MSTPIFRKWPDNIYKIGCHTDNTVYINNEWASWQKIYEEACRQSHLIRAGIYIIDPNKGLQSIISLLTVTMVPGASFIWSTPQKICSKFSQLLPCIYTGASLPKSYRNIDRPFYGTLTSGTSSTAKVAIGFADQLTIIGTMYDIALYNEVLPPATTGGIIACCLPVEYSATFMMAILPAWITARKLILFKPDEWEIVLARKENEPIAIIIAPCMLPTAYAYVRNKYDSKHITFITTAGFLSKERVYQMRDKFPNAKFLISYGSTETGIMTLGEFDENINSVGKPLYGKKIWLRDINSNVGRITTSGIDCREFYYHSNEKIRSIDGTVSNTDFGHFDNNNNLYLDGRIDQAIKINGILIYPKVIERHILSLSNVLDVSINIKTKKLGTADIEAIVVGEITEDELRKQCEFLDKQLRPNIYKILSHQDAVYSNNGKLMDKNHAE